MPVVEIACPVSLTNETAITAVLKRYGAQENFILMLGSGTAFTVIALIRRTVSQFMIRKIIYGEI